MSKINLWSCDFCKKKFQNHSGSTDINSVGIGIRDSKILLEYKIIIRDQPNTHMCPECLRNELIKTLED